MAIMCTMSDYYSNYMHPTNVPVMCLYMYFNEIKITFEN